MLRPAFRHARLAFGRHDDAFELAETGRPIVVSGPNGSGKSTLVEGMVRTLFGYEKRRPADAAALDARRPWGGADPISEVTIAVNGGAVRIRRDYATDRVRVDVPDTGVVHFDGDGNPGASNQEARHYRRLLTELFGISDLDAYLRTLYIRQGDLPGTTIGDHLLRVAAGGHARVDGARRDIAESHRGVTRRPIHPAARAAINARELEKLDEEIAAVRARLEAASQAGEMRGPLALERDRAAERLAALDHESRLLEDARAALARTGITEIEARQLRDRGRKLDRSAAGLRRALDENAAAEAALRDALAGGPYPDDFAQRLAALELRWRDLDDLSRGSARWPALAGLAALLAATALWLAGYITAASIAAGAALLAGAAWLGLHLEARKRAGRARAEVSGLLADVPAGDTLSPATQDRHRSRFLGQRDALARRSAARTDLAKAAREARTLLRDGGHPAGSRASGVAPPDQPRGVARVDALGTALEEAAASARDRLARLRVDLERLGDASLNLPDGVPPLEADVADALAGRRGERVRLQEQVQALGQELLERGTPTESMAALRSTLDELVPRREALDLKARALEAAHALVTDAYDAFRSRDQERLLAGVSAHANALSGGGAGPVQAQGALEDATVRIGGRQLPLESPPLSFGELHALLLAVRLGAADFLGGIGVLPPLIVDEPFAHLDIDRAHAVWRSLCLIAAQRQVLVTTQDRLLLAELGVPSDLVLPAS